MKNSGGVISGDVGKEADDKTKILGGVISGYVRKESDDKTKILGGVISGYVPKEADDKTKILGSVISGEDAKDAHSNSDSLQKPNLKIPSNLLRQFVDISDESSKILGIMYGFQEDIVSCIVMHPQWGCEQEVHIASLLVSNSLLEKAYTLLGFI